MLIIYTYFCFLVYKIYNKKANVLVSKNFLFNKFLAIFYFLIINMEAAATNVLNLLHILKYFYFFVYKNYDIKMVILIVSMLIIKTFLSNIFLSVFVFFNYKNEGNNN